MKNFWQKLPTPFTVLAPLEGVTDFSFRQMVINLGKPDVLFTEFTSCDGLQSNGKKSAMQNLMFKPNEQPIVAQIWGTDPENIYKSALEISQLGFSGLDLNMGCPDRTVMKSGAGGKLIKNPELASEIIRAAKQGAPELPLSIKTRIGFETVSVEEWIGFLLKQDISALTIHLRTVKEQSLVPAHWELMPEIIQIRDKYAPKTIIIGNGDIKSLYEINEKYTKYKCEGFMIGRGIFADPWVFNKTKNGDDRTIIERLETFAYHVNLFEKIWGNTRNFANLKKFCKAYINNFPNAARYREKIMETRSLEELKKTITETQNTVAKTYQ